RSGCASSARRTSCVGSVIRSPEPEPMGLLYLGSPRRTSPEAVVLYLGGIIQLLCDDRGEHSGVRLQPLSGRRPGGTPPWPGTGGTVRSGGTRADDPGRCPRYDSLAIDLASACYPTRERLRALGAIAGGPIEPVRADSSNRTARCLLGLVVRTLPAGHRARYAEEFRTELTCQPQRERLVYALRVAGSS